MATIGRTMGLFRPMFYSSLRARVVGCRREMTTGTKGVFIPTLGTNNGIARCHYGIYRTSNGLFFRGNINSANNGMTFSHPRTTPGRMTSVFDLRNFPTLRVGTNNFNLQISTIIVLGYPIPRDEINGTPTFRILRFFGILLSTFNNLLLFANYPLTITLYQITIAPRADLSLYGVNFFKHVTLATMWGPILTYMILHFNNDNYGIHGRDFGSIFRGLSPSLRRWSNVPYFKTTLPLTTSSYTRLWVITT